MASGKVKTSDVIQEDLFKDPIESGLAFLQTLEQIEKQLKETVSASAKLASSKPLDSYKNVKEVEQGINQATKAVEQLEAVEKERIKLEQRLLDLQSEQIKKNAELRVQIQEQTKANKEAAKEKLGLVSLYQKESARLNELRKQYKELAIQNKENTKEGKELLKNIQQLDTKLKDIDEQVGQSTRKVGSYEKAVKKVTDALEDFKKTGTGAFVIGGVGAAVLAIGALFKSFQNTAGGAAATEKAIAQVTIRIGVFVGVLVEAFSKIDQKAGAFGKIESFFENISKGLETYEERVNKALDAENKAIDTSTEYTKKIVGLTNSVAILRKEQAKLEVQSEDNTLSFATQTEAANKLLDVNAKIAESELKILALRLKVVEQRRAAALIAGGTNAAIEEEYAALLLELADKNAEIAAATSAIEKKKREDLSDTAELQLDALVDGFDTQKTINERLIADETLTFEKRRAILLQTQKSGEDSFRKQIAILQSFTKERIDADKLLAEQDSIALEQQILSAGLSEALQIQLLTVIRDRKTAIQDLSDAEKELSNDETRYLKASVNLQEEAIKALKERGANLALIQRTLAEKTLQNDIDNLNAKLRLVEKGSEEELRIRQELNDKILQQETNRIEKQKKKEQELQQASLAITNALVDKRVEVIISGIDKQIAGVQKRQDQLRELATKGAQDADENLAIEEKKQAELEAKKERVRRNAARLQLIVAGIETYSSKVSAGDENALGSTLTDITILTQALEALSLPGFYSGTERVADSAKPTLSGAIDSYLIRADGNERIMTGAQNSMIGQMSNQELATLAHNYNTGKLAGSDNGQLLERIDKLIEIEQSKPTYLGRDYDATERAITDTIAYRGRIERNKKKAGRLF